MIQSVEQVGADTAHVRTLTTFEGDRGEKPVCVAVQVGRFVESALDSSAGTS
ncbi:hypothetical protein ACWEKJ_39320 [Amycolatopsis thermoflava]